MCGLEETHDRSQHRGLPRTVGAEKAEDFAVRDGESHVLHASMASVVLGQAIDDDRFVRVRHHVLKLWTSSQLAEGRRSSIASKVCRHLWERDLDACGIERILDSSTKFTRDVPLCSGFGHHPHPKHDR